METKVLLVTRWISLKSIYLLIQIIEVKGWKKKKNKAIYGKASKQEIDDLKQEGIKTEEFPWIEDKEN